MTRRRTKAAFVVCILCAYCCGTMTFCENTTLYGETVGVRFPWSQYSDPFYSIHHSPSGSWTIHWREKEKRPGLRVCRSHVLIRDGKWVGTP